jgi:hypothetical protein
LTALNLPTFLTTTKPVIRYLDIKRPTIYL